MELVLSLDNGNQVQVACDRRASHAFALESVSAADPAALYNALFPPGSPARAALASADRLALVLDESLDSLPWELSRGPEGWLALQLPLVRLTPPLSRHPAPKLDSPLRVVAVPSNPVAHDLPPLNIAGEWRRLREAFEKLTHSVRLERVNPPTLDSLRRAALRSPQAVIHFMGHGSQTGEQAVLYFENESGGLQPVTAKDFALSVSKLAFLVTLNTCVSAAPGPTEFSNLARLLVGRGLPYALGMSASILDSDALTFSRALYGELAAGVDVEQAVFQARLGLLRGNPREWLAGVPVLYSSLEQPAGGFATPAGQPKIDEGQPPLDVTVLPRAEGAFQGRIDALLTLGKALTGEPRPKIYTIHGMGGQGKTALAREAVERFAHAWPGGVWAVSLENKPNRATFCFQLAQFLKIPTENFPQSADLKRVILARLEAQRLLIVLDNAETFTEATRANNSDALDLAAFLKEGLLGTAASLLVTSREPLGWPGEQSLPLEGLSEAEGAALFTQSAPQRQTDIQSAQAAALSARLDGHPLALLLLGLAFNDTAISLEQFIAEHETRLLNAENKYKAADHRHRSLYASIETSVRYLSEDERALLSGLWIFQAPFLPETAAQVFTAPSLYKGDAKTQQEKILAQLYVLHRRGLLLREIETLSVGNLTFYTSLPTMHLFVKHYLTQALSAEALQISMGKTYAALLRNIRDEIDRTSWASTLVRRCRKDMETYVEWVEGNTQGWYVNHLGLILQRLGDRQASLRWLEHALELAQGADQQLELDIINNLALVYSNTGQPIKALELYERALLIRREIGDWAGETTTLNNMGVVYSNTGQPGKALELFEQVLLMERKDGDRAGEATTLSNMALIYSDTSQPVKALEIFERALPIRREVGDRAGEAATLNNMAGVYHKTGKSDKALELYEQALSLACEVGDRAGEAATLNNIALIYYRTVGRQTGKALKLFEQVLQIQREVGNRAGEAATLNNMGTVYRDTNQTDKALELFERVLPIRHEVGDRAGEATTLNNMATLYSDTGRSDKALQFFERALFTRREVGDQVGEANTLNNIATVYSETGQLGKALEIFKQAQSIQHTVGDPAGEATTYFNMAMLAREMGQARRAIDFLQHAVHLEKQVRHLTYLQDAETLAKWEAAMARGEQLPSRAHIGIFDQFFNMVRKWFGK